jgi:hypothetical protein
MKIRHMVLASFVGWLALASPARAVIAITFTEGAEGGEVIPIPTVSGIDPALFGASGGTLGNVELINFFAVAPAVFSFTFSLLEPDGSVSDQITFSNNFPNLAGNLFVTFTSDPANFTAAGIYGTAPETGGLQTIPLPANMPGGRDTLGNPTLSVLAQSDLDPPVPELATWGMMLVGFAAIGLTTRYRRRRPNLTQVA